MKINRAYLCAALFTLICLACTLASSQGTEKSAAGKTQKEPAAGSSPKIEFEKYYLVLLRRGPSWTPASTPAVQELQKQHLAHLQKMGESGKLLIAGPFGEQQDQTLRGMCLYRVASLEEARALAEADPMVKAGRLKVETAVWFVEKGYMTFPKAPRLE